MTETAKSERDLKQLLGGLRVAIPGVQFLFAFLLVIPFDVRFREVDTLGMTLFVFAHFATLTSSVLLIAPSVYHRLHFESDPERQDATHLCRVFNRLAIAGTACLALAITAAIAFLASFLYGVVGAIVAGLYAAALTGGLWFVLPLRRHLRRARRVAIVTA